LMATPAQIEANRLNAKKSTGPKTFKGKTRCKMNALKHGFTTAQAVMDPLEEDLLPTIAQSITHRLRPQDELELALVDHIIQAAWRLRRLPRIETDYLRALQYTPGKSLGESLFDTDQQRKLFSLSNHETRIEKSMYRAIEQLATIRKIAPILSPEEKAQPVAFI